MSKFEVSTAELNNAVANLTEKRNEFTRRLADLLELQEQLSSQWSGDASTAFAQAFHADKAQWDSFANVLESYIQALRTISQSYDQTEETNKGIASNRTYR